jgi:hypothetical protein
MDVKPPAAEIAVETCGRYFLDFAMALTGVPRQDRDQWLLTQTQERVAKARARGADDRLAQAWSDAWHGRVSALIALDSD